MLRYRGIRPRDAGRIGPVTVTVTADDGTQYELRPDASLAMRRHSPDGFEWGYHGSGPAQLALALLMDATNDIRVASGAYQSFKSQVVATWSHDEWTYTSEEVLRWLASTGAMLKLQPEADAGRCLLCGIGTYPPEGGACSNPKCQGFSDESDTVEIEIISHPPEGGAV